MKIPEKYLREIGLKVEDVVDGLASQRGGG